MQWCHSEPTIAEMLSDPIIRALMTADRVVPDELETNLREIAGALRGPGCAKTRRPNPPRSSTATLASPRSRQSLRAEGVHRVEHVKGQD